MIQRLHLLGLLLPLAALPAQEANATQVTDAATLEREYNAAQQQWMTSVRSATPEERAELLKARPEAEFVPRFQAGAKQYAGTDEAVPYLDWLVARGDSETAKSSLTTLMEHHLESSGIVRSVSRIGDLRQALGAAQARKWLDQLVEKNPDENVQAQARFTRAAAYVGTTAVEHSDELRKLAVADLELVVADGPSPSLTARATTLLYEAKNLEPGLPAPDISGEDLDGTPFKLSDYKGKVVLLDFWGDW